MTSYGAELLSYHCKLKALHQTTSSDSVLWHGGLYSTQNRTKWKYIIETSDSNRLCMSPRFTHDYKQPQSASWTSFPTISVRPEIENVRVPKMLFLYLKPCSLASMWWLLITEYWGRLAEDPATYLASLRNRNQEETSIIIRHHN